MADAGRKHTDVEVAARRADVRAVLIKGRWSRRIAQAIADKHGVSMRMVYEEDRAAVLREMRESLSEEARENARGLWHAQMDDLFATAMEAKDHGLAVKILAMKGKAIGVEAPRQHEVSGPRGGPVVVVNREHLAAALLELEAEADAADDGSDG